MYKKIDRSEIHQKLWERRDRWGRVELHQRDFAVELEVTHYTVSRLIAELIESGALKKISSKYRNVGVYAVREPK